MMAAVSTAIMAVEASSSSGNPAGVLSMGAGYERYEAEWVGSHSVKREVFQNRVYIQGDYRVARRLRTGARLGAAGLSACDLDDIDHSNHVDYSLSPYGSIILNWTPVGALQGTIGGAIEIMFAVSAFATYTADKIEGSIDGFGMTTEYEAWPEVSSMWEAKLSILLAAHNGSYSFGAGLTFLESGAETRTRIKTQWNDGTLTNYFKTQNQVGILYSFRLSPGLATRVDTEVIWMPPHVRFEISLARVLIR